MNTEVLLLHPLRPQPALIEQACAIIRRGGLVAFPTETVYGLGANALDASAVQRIYAAKGRPSNNPLIVHVADTTAASALTSAWSETAQTLAERFWPGPLTMVLPRHEQVPAATTGGGATIALRVPRHPVALALLQQAALPIAAPSANRSGELTATKAEHVLQSLGGNIQMILDGGPTPGGLESTVVDLSTTPPTLLRPGLIAPQELRALLPAMRFGEHLLQPMFHPKHPTDADPDTPLASPGMLFKHYSPQATLECFAADGWQRVQEQLAAGKVVGWLRWGHRTNLKHASLHLIDMPSEAEPYASCLYSRLHELDQLKAETVVLDLPPDNEHWLAVRDRLRRAASVWQEESCSTPAH